eukprot:GDKI01024448.1.p1 GENE.GDKI01024448.1~~GDKI01024448.1.p1  ORF type:complete len:155 (-),score=39.07 GDKI01024448.1:253-717(-)
MSAQPPPTASSISAGAPSSSAATHAQAPPTSAHPTPTPPMHFCESTNTPTDVCNSQWLLLWTTAAYTAEKPSEAEKRDAFVFFSQFVDQCKEGPAAQCYADAVRTMPPRVESRRDLVMWLCMVENQCRAKLQMPLKTCRYNTLMQRWRYPDGYL